MSGATDRGVRGGQVADRAPARTPEAPGLVNLRGVRQASPNFRELRTSEVRRIPLPSTPVNKGMKRRAGVWKPGPQLALLPIVF
jgi:hypothetical protein